MCVHSYRTQTYINTCKHPHSNILQEDIHTNQCVHMHTHKTQLYILYNKYICGCGCFCLCEHVHAARNITCIFMHAFTYISITCSCIHINKYACRMHPHAVLMFKFMHMCTHTFSQPCVSILHMHVQSQHLLESVHMYMCTYVGTTPLKVCTYPFACKHMRACAITCIYPHTHAHVHVFLEIIFICI